MKIRPRQKRLRLEAAEATASRLSSVQASARHDVLEALRSGKWIEKEVNCPVCEENSGAVVSEIDRYGIPVETRICDSCSLLYSTKQMRLMDYEDFYRSVYRRLYDGSEKPSVTFLEEQRRRGNRLIRVVSKFVVLENREVFEVGVGAGGILDAFSAVGAHVHGCDLGVSYLEAGLARGLDLVEGGIDRLPSESADVLVYSHVLEHVQDLEKEFQEIRRVLRPEGVLVVEVPGLRDLHRQYGGDLLEYLQNAHLYHFTKKTLISLCERYGMEPIWVNEHVFGLFRKGQSAKRKTPFAKAGWIRLYLGICSSSRYLLKPLGDLVLRCRR